MAQNLGVWVWASGFGAQVLGILSGVLGFGLSSLEFRVWAEGFLFEDPAS